MKRERMTAGVREVHASEQEHHRVEDAWSPQNNSRLTHTRTHTHTHWKEAEQNPLSMGVPARPPPPQARATKDQTTEETSQAAFLPSLFLRDLRVN